MYEGGLSQDEIRADAIRLRTMFADREAARRARRRAIWIKVAAAVAAAVAVVLGIAGLE